MGQVQRLRAIAGNRLRLRPCARQCCQNQTSHQKLSVHGERFQGREMMQAHGRAIMSAVPRTVAMRRAVYPFVSDGRRR